jgi:hypothetical protein
MPILSDFTHLPLCEGCIMAKIARIYFHTFQMTPFHAILNLVHFDICGPMQTFHLGVPNIPDTPMFII